MAVKVKKSKVKVKSGGKVKSKVKVKKARPSVSNMIPLDDLSPKARKLIARLDTVHAAIEEKESLLEQLVNELGASSFEHPDLGPMSVMSRVIDDEKTTWWWRTKPEGHIPAAKTRKLKKAA